MREKPHILLIAIDTLRADHLSCYGYRFKTSPFIDKLASEGALFYNAYAPAIPTHPGYTTMLTGVHPLHHQIVCHSGNVRLSPEIKLIGEYLKSLGYVTGTADNLINRKGSEWFSWGFNYYFNTGGYMVISKGIKVHGEVVLNRALEFLDIWSRYHRDKSFFLFVHFWDPHAPYYPPRELAEKYYSGDLSSGDLVERLEKTVWGRLLLKGWVGKLVKEGIRDMDYIRALYDAEITYSDEKVKKLYEKLEELGIVDDTVIIVTSDHGESMGEHDIFFDHHGLYEWDIRVPLIIRYPPEISRNTRFEGFVQHTDIVPTVLYLAGYENPVQLDGHNLLEAIRGTWKGYEQLVFMENTRMTKRAYRKGGWKLIETIREDPYGREPGHLELFDLNRDPLEKVNLVESERDLAYQLLGELESNWRRILGNLKDPLIEQEISLPIT